MRFIGKIVHEIGHAIGFWHEQSRPKRQARDGFIAINLQKDEENQFMRQSYTEVNSRGSAYNYGSIMIHPLLDTTVATCEGCKSLRVTNDVAYTKQRRPTMGQENDLSIHDILQVKSLFLPTFLLWCTLWHPIIIAIHA